MSESVLNKIEKGKKLALSTLPLSFQPSLPSSHLSQFLGTWFLLVAVYAEDQGI